MSDFNPFEVTGKAVRRTYETVEDANSLLLNAGWDHSPCALFETGRIAKEQSSDILWAAKQALNHEDVKEATHQLYRELYFSSIVNELAGSPDEVATRAGLEAVKQGEDAHAIAQAIDDAWLKTLINECTKPAG
jgi:hypothetical protein